MNRATTALFAPRALLSTCALVAGLASSGCTILYAFNSSEEGLPCDTGAEPCLDGFTCVDNRCIVANAKEVGEACAVDTECATGLLCADFYGPACAEVENDDPNCRLVDQNDEGLRCRAGCDPQAVDDGCPLGTRCFVREDGAGFCQQGTCTEQSDCTGALVVGAEGLCAGTDGENRTGLCFEECNPLFCAGGVCNSCDGFDGVPDGFNCVPLPGTAFNQGFTACVDPVGNIPAGESCLTGLCEAGSFCGVHPSTQVVQCIQWCKFTPPQNPGCDVGTCVQISGDVGFCQ